MKVSGIKKNSSDEYGPLGELLVDSFGLKLGPSSKKFQQAVRTRLQALKLGSVAKYQAWLENADRGDELFTLAGELLPTRSDFSDLHLVTICEQFLRPILRSRLVNRPEGSKPSLSIWSVGCGNAAEIYSVLMQMAKLTQLSGWQLRILGTDLSPKSITQARQGVYGTKELKTVSREDLGNFFSNDPAEPDKENRWTIAKTLSSVCEFRQHNILSPEVPGGFPDRFNLIFCRGVLKHLSKTAREEVLSKLARSLSPDGLLIVGAGQADRFDQSLLEVEPEESESAFRRRTGPPKPIQAKPSANQQLGKTMGLRHRLRQVLLSSSTRKQAKKRKRPRKVVDARTVARECLQRARHLAKDFQFPQALLACRKARELDEFNVEAHYLIAVLARKMDRQDEAIKALERACYLDKTLVMGHFLLAHIYQETHRPALARHRYSATLKTLEAKPADEPIRFSDGLSKKMLRDLCVAGEQALVELGVGE